MQQLSGYLVSETIYDRESVFLYRGQRQRDGRAVTLKGMRTHSATPDDLTSLKHEYEIVSSLALDSPWINPPHDLERIDDIVLLVMDDFGGVPLRHLLSSRPMPPLEALRLGSQLAAALGDLHRHNVVHKDIQPDNILVNPATGELKLTNFGIASRFSSDQQNAYSGGHLEGTLAYMSPEQTGRMNRALDYRTDFYSLGITLYELLTGQLPLQADDPIAWVHCHIAVAPQAPHTINAQLPRGLSSVVLKLMAKTAEERYQSAAGLQVDLDECLERLHNNGNLDDFSPGQRDVSDRFQISQKLYGREHELRIVHKISHATFYISFLGTAT